MIDTKNEIIIAVIGLGYVGLPLACLFATKYKVVGYDINQDRIEELQQGIDLTKEVTQKSLKSVLVKNLDLNERGLLCSHEIKDIEEANYYIITVPTPVDESKNPNLIHIIEASNLVGKKLNKGDIVIYESTVYPGVTEEICVPVLEETSGLIFNKEFHVGYSPERVNPGDKNHTIDKIVKITSGSTKSVGKKIDKLYGSIIEAGTYLTPSIRIAEAAKVIENSQRDINIAFVNELAKIFNLMDIDTQEVLDAAGTKWNFLPFKPGLVGGHCIGVDPYYLADKAQEIGYNPEVILSGRRVNDSMGQYVGQQIIKLMINKKIKLNKSKALILGVTFKENCPDIRNSKVIDLISELQKNQIEPIIYDPHADPGEVKKEFSINSSKSLPKGSFDCIVLCVSHKEFSNLNLNYLKNHKCVVYDVKGGLKGKIDKQL